MSQVIDREISDGYPVDGQVFEPPQQRRDSEDPCFVSFIGSVVTPETVQDRPWTKGGGIEISNPCLRFVKHFLRKGRITPVLKDVHDWCTVDYWEKATAKDASYFLRQVPKGYVAPDRDELGNRSPVPPMMGKLARPGEQIDSIVNGSAARIRNVRRGVVEFKTLRGQPYDPQPLGDGIVADASIWQIQKTIFPKWPFLPILLDDLERLLADATVHTLLRPIVDEMMLSLGQFRDYAIATVEQTHYNMRESGRKSESGYIPRYVDLDFVLLEQLGMARQDINIRKETTAISGDPELRDMFKQFIALQVEEKEAIAAERKAQATAIPAPDINETTMMAEPITQADIMAEPEAGDTGQPGTSGYSGASGEVMTLTEIALKDQQASVLVEPEFVCACGQPAKSLAGLKAHQRSCDKSGE